LSYGSLKPASSASVAGFSRNRDRAGARSSAGARTTAFWPITKPCSSTCPAHGSLCVTPPERNLPLY